MKCIFCYGSNHKEKLKSITGADEITSEGAYLPNYTRIFCDYSDYWKGAVASVYPKKGECVYGAIVYLTKEQLRKLDKWEYGYQRRTMNVYLLKDMKTLKRADVYIKRDTSYKCPPSKEYMEAIGIMLKEIGIQQKIPINIKI